MFTLTPFRKIVLIFAVAALAAYVSLPKEFSLGGRDFVRKNLNVNLGGVQIHKSFDTVLGLDLAGGSHLVFEVDTSNVPDERKDSVLEGLREVIESRVNFFGISEPNVQLSSFEGKDRILVELPGVKDTEKAIGLIGQTAELKFAEINLEDEGFVDTDLTGADLEESYVDTSSFDGSYVVAIRFNEEGTSKFSELTERNIGQPLAILIDDVVISAPVVSGHIPDGNAIVTGDFTRDDAKNLSIQLNAGALPAPIKLIAQRTVGASLGSESVARSVDAGLIGLGMVLLFMVMLYGKYGIIANVGLIIFGVLTFALYKLIPVVLTLPGIAGFLLSVGMAVDSNILIFERLKEEKDKREFSDALEVSFGRAWDSIRDANIATLFTAFLLANPLDWSFLHTSGPVRGFAITLALGIAISLFTGIVVTRNLMRVFIKKK